MKKPLRKNFDGDIPVQITYKEALKSPMQIRVGAVLFRGREILGTGYSHHNIWSDPSTRTSIHAERATLVGLRHDIIRGSDIVIVRVGKSDTMLPIQPCIQCESILRRKGIRKIYYWNEDVEIRSLLL